MVHKSHFLEKIGVHVENASGKTIAAFDLVRKSPLSMLARHTQPKSSIKLHTYDSLHYVIRVH